MNRLALLLALVASTVSAQEIGSEIQPAPAEAAANKATPPPLPPPAARAPVSAGSAGKGQLGIRATFFGSPTSNLPTAAIGVAFFVSDLLKLTLDAGFAASFPPANTGARTTVGFAIAAGVDLLFRSTAASARPFVTAQLGFGKLNSATDDFSLVINVGGGGEYFFSQFFSMNIRGLISTPINFRTGALGFLLFTPGVGATVYF